MNPRSCLVLAIIILLSGWTAESQVISFKPEIQRGDLSKPQGLWPLLGLSLGAMDHNDRVRTGGVTSHVKVIGSYNFDEAPWVADAGIGLHNHVLTQRGKDSDSIQSLYTEVAARYKFANRWQFGAIWNTLVDNPDRYRSNTNNLASFIGLQALKEFIVSDNYLVRAGGRVMTDVGISGETLDTFMAEIQVSFGNHSRPIAKAPAPKPVAPHLAKRAIQTFEFTDPGPVHFETDSTRLIPSSERYLRRLARVIAENRHLFDRIAIIGHTDQRGTDEYNLRLSHRRAYAVLNILASAGLSAKRLEAYGRGKMDLLSQFDTPVAMQKNRRVQIEFHGVKNKQALKNIIDSVSP